MESISRKLSHMSLPELKTLGTRLELPPRRSKSEMVRDIYTELKYYEDYRKTKVDCYKRLKQLGEPGKEGTTYLVQGPEGKTYAMKTFRKTKASSALKKEYELQKLAAAKKVAPKVYDLDTAGKWIVMEKMDKHLFEGFFIPSEEQQKEIIEMFRKLDKAGVYHGDANLANYMVKKGKIRLIDYGFSKPIDDKLKKSHGEFPNYRVMTIGLIMKLKEKNCPEKGYKYLLRHVTPEDRVRYGL